MNIFSNRNIGILDITIGISAFIFTSVFGIEFLGTRMLMGYCVGVTIAFGLFRMLRGD